MSVGDVDRVLRNGGRLIADPTSLSDPYGGTELGVIGELVLQQFWLTEQATGADDRHAGESLETWYVGENWLIACTLRQWDNSPLSVFFPNRITGATRTVIADQYSGVAGVRRPGTKLSSAAKKILFVPNNLNNPGVIFYKAVPILQETQEIQLTATEEQKVGVLLQAMYHQSIGKLYKTGLLSELSLT